MKENETDHLEFLIFLTKESISKGNSKWDTELIMVHRRKSISKWKNMNHEKQTKIVPKLK